MTAVNLASGLIDYFSVAPLATHGQLLQGSSFAFSHTRVQIDVKNRRTHVDVISTTVISITISLAVAALQ